MDRFRRTFEVTGGKLLVADEGDTPPLGDGEVDQEAINRYSGEGEPAAPASPSAASDGE